MKDALLLIAEERERQISAEGWTLAHDDTHTDGDLARAAAAYALPTPRFLGTRSTLWPWGRADFKPTPDDRVRELTKAGALIVAEIERLQRAATP